MYTLKAENRTEGRKAKQLRKAGKIPACIYSADHKSSILMQLAQNDVLKLTKSIHEGALLSLETADGKKAVLLKEVSRSAVDRKVEDLSFQELVADVAVKTTAELVIVGQEKTVGTAEQILFELPYKALPAKLVETVTVDVSGKKAGEGVTVADLPFAHEEGVELLLDANEMIVHIVDSAKLAAAAAAAVEAADAATAAPAETPAPADAKAKPDDKTTAPADAKTDAKTAK